MDLDVGSLSFDLDVGSFHERRMQDKSVTAVLGLSPVFRRSIYFDKDVMCSGPIILFLCRSQCYHAGSVDDLARAP